MTSRVSKVCAHSVLALALTAAGSAGCGGSDAPPSGDHKVFFFGYVYDGATGTRLGKDAITSMSISYRDQVLDVQVQNDGRFVTRSPLPTWQDYTVTIDATGYRAFFSQNRGIDVPASYTQNDIVATSGSTQTFQFDAYVFPTSVVAPAVTLNVNLPTDVTSTTPAPKATGTARLRPTSASSIESTPDSSRFRRWPNDNDLLTQTITKAFTNGKVEVAEGEMVYGVAYQLSVFDVDGYQPMVATPNLVAGTLTSRSYDLIPESRDPIRVQLVDSTGCAIPIPTANTYGAQITIHFNQNVAFVGTTYREDVDNGLYVATTPTTTTTYTCPLNTSADASMQERGTKVDVVDSAITLSWNPSMAWAPTYQGLTCGLTSAVNSVTYGISNLIVVPAGGDSRTEARSLSSLLQERLITQLICPAPR